MNNVNSAVVTLNIPPDDGTLISRNQETYASVKLDLNSPLSEEQIAGIARYVATEVGNSSTDNITIIDNNSNLLFAGGMENSYMGLASSQLTYQAKREEQVKQAISDVIDGTNLYSNVEVGLNLVLDFDQVTQEETNYSAQAGREEGLLTSEIHHTSDAQGGYVGEPGTDSNDAPTYVIDDSNITSSSVTDDELNHALDQKNTQTIKSVGDIKYDESSVTLALAHYVYYDEDVLRENGTLDDMTFDEFIAQNDQRVPTEVDDALYDMVSNATGIPVGNITIVSYDIPMFNPSTGSGRGWQDYMQIVLVVLIFALLGYVVFRSTRKEKEAELEPELSVEALLETTREAEQEELEDIGYNEKSETRLR
ncbi:MAG: flagellar biosynthesis protein, partial [Lachnospiraceae bacterium]|nr:flagellar biosynthesis protein [Lachnospiraceae bacterium]